MHVENDVSLVAQGKVFAFDEEEERSDRALTQAAEESHPEKMAHILGCRLAPRAQRILEDEDAKKPLESQVKGHPTVLRDRDDGHAWQK